LRRFSLAFDGSHSKSIMMFFHVMSFLSDDARNVMVDWAEGEMCYTQLRKLSGYHFLFR
jgi:hypothetical protein